MRFCYCSETIILRSICIWIQAEDIIDSSALAEMSSQSALGLLHMSFIGPMCACKKKKIYVLHFFSLFIVRLVICAS